jgi:hypothetical protein
VEDWTFGDVIWSMIVFFCWVIFIWMFIAIFTDILRRDDVSGWGKAGWLILIIILPFLGILIYMIARPKMTAQDQRMLGQLQAREHRMAGYSVADEIDKLARLRDEGKISPAEFETLKQRAMS